MKVTRQHNSKGQQLNFRQWSRKGYAVFASLGRTVRIATLKTAVADGLKDKSGAAANALPLMAMLVDDNNELDDALPEITSPELLLCQPIATLIQSTQTAVAACSDKLISLIDNTNPVGTCRQGFLFYPHCQYLISKAINTLKIVRYGNIAN
jgi:hypothetical protein